jgi:hypothetical protein
MRNHILLKKQEKKFKCTRCREWVKEIPALVGRKEYCQRCSHWATRESKRKWLVDSKKFNDGHSAKVPCKCGKLKSKRSISCWACFKKNPEEYRKKYRRLIYNGVRIRTAI